MAGTMGHGHSDDASLHTQACTRPSAAISLCWVRGPRDHSEVLELLGSWVFGLMALIALGGGLWMVISQLRFEARALEASATIADNRLSAGGRSHARCYLPVYGFTPQGAETAVQATAGLCYSEPPAIGTVVSVRYDPSDPSSVEVKDGPHRPFFVLGSIIILTGLGSALASYVLAKVSRPRDR
jgi:Protein of unknown function (DUF3592)